MRWTRINTKEVCLQLSVTPKMLRIYEEHDLVLPKRGDNNYRDYSDADLLRIRSIVVLRKLGFSIYDIGQILSLGGSENECMEMFYIQLKAVEKRISDLGQIRSRLRDNIGKFLNDENSENLLLSLGSVAEEKAVYVESEHPVDGWDFDEMAANYIDRFLKADEPYKLSIKKTRTLLRKILPGKSVIDVGCGTCNLWIPLRALFEKKNGKAALLTAMDKSLPMLMAARENIDFGKMRCDDILAYDLDCNEKYDIVVSSFMLHHIEQNMHKLAIENMIRLCKTGGTVLIIDKSYDNMSRLAAYEREMVEIGDESAVQILHRECPILRDAFVSYMHYLGHQVETELLMDGIMLYRIWV